MEQGSLDRRPLGRPGGQPAQCHKLADEALERALQAFDLMRTRLQQRRGQIEQRLRGDDLGLGVIVVTTKWGLRRKFCSVKFDMLGIVLLV